MVSAGLGLLALLALSACAWGQPLNSVTDVQIPPTSCYDDNDCGGTERGRCITNWPQNTNNEELARLLLPEFKASNFWSVCQCHSLPNGKMPKGPRCEEEASSLVRTCNNDAHCGGSMEGGRCLFREDGYGYCVCLRTRRGDRCQDSTSEKRIGEQQYIGGPYYPGGGIYNGGLYGYPNLLGYQTGGYYGGNQPYYSNGYYNNGLYGRGYQLPYYNGNYGSRYGAAFAPSYGYYGNGARYGGNYLGYQAPYNNNYYGNGLRYGAGYPYYGNGVRYGSNALGYQAPYNNYYGNGLRYAAGYQLPFGGYYGNSAAFQPTYGGLYQGFQPYGYNQGFQPGYFGSYNRAYLNGFNQPYYQTGLQLPYYGGLANYGGYPYNNYATGSQLIPRTTYYQNYQLPAYQLPALYRPATTYYQPYLGSSTGGAFPWSLYALTYSSGQPSVYGSNLFGGVYPGYNLGYTGYNLGYANPIYNYGYNYPGYNQYNLGYAYPRYNLGNTYLGYNTFPGYNLGYNFPRYNFGNTLPAYNLGALYPRTNYGYNLGLAFPSTFGSNLGYPGFFGGYYGQNIGFQPGISYRPGGVLPGYPVSGAFPVGASYPGIIGGGFVPGYGTPYYTGIVAPTVGSAPYNFYGGLGGYLGVPGAVSGAFPSGLSPVPGITSYRPPTAYPYPYADPRIGFTQAPGTVGTGTVPAPSTVTPVATAGTLPVGGIYGGANYGPYATGYGLGFNPAGYGFGYGGGMLRFNKLTGNYVPSNIPYAAALGGPQIGASPVAGVSGMAVASGGTSLMANEGKAGGWEPSLMPQFCDPSHPSGGFCQNGGVCQNNAPNGVTCSCPPGWMGRACETERGVRGLQAVTPYTFGCGCTLAVNGPSGELITPAGQAIAPGSCINPCVMTAMDRLRAVGGAANPAFNSNNQPDLFPSAEAGPAGYLQCGDRNHPAGNCHIKPCAPGTIFSFGAQVCTADDSGMTLVGAPTAAVGNAFFPGFFSGVNSPAVGAIPVPFKKK